MSFLESHYSSNKQNETSLSSAMSLDVKGSPGGATLGVPKRNSLSSRSAANSRATTPTTLSVFRSISSRRSSIRVLPANGGPENNSQKLASIECNYSLASQSTTALATLRSPSTDCDGDVISPPPTSSVGSSPVQLSSSVAAPQLSAFSLGMAPPLVRSTSSSAFRSTPHGGQSTAAAAATDGQVQRRWITSDRMNELRKRTHEAIRQHKVFTIRGCFATVRKALLLRGYVEKLDQHRRASMALNLTMDEMIHQLPSRQPGESKRQYIYKCERNIISRFLEHTPVDFLWTFRKVFYQKMIKWRLSSPLLLFVNPFMRLL